MATIRFGIDEISNTNQQIDKKCAMIYESQNVYWVMEFPAQSGK